MKIRLKIKTSLFFLTIFFMLSQTGNAQNKKIERSCPLVFDTHKNGGKQSLRYAANHALDKTDTTIKTLLIYIHGIDRNGLDYFDFAEDMIRSAKQKKETLLIAPQFANSEDLDYYKLSNDFLYWKKSEWKYGYTSISIEGRPQAVKMSSYEVLDSLLATVLSSNKFPNIKMVVVAGHSAGGQFVQRYSATTPLPDQMAGFKFRFIAMNPSSYMYADARRPVGNNTFAIPDTTGCPEYNRFPKGLTALNTYARAMGAGNIRNNIFKRDIVILLGENDTRTDDPNLDVTCDANLQGPFRLQRGLNYVAYLSTFPEYGKKINYNIVPGSGHDGNKMINSAEAKKWIYGDK